MLRLLRTARVLRLAGAAAVLAGLVAWSGPAWPAPPVKRVVMVAAYLSDDDTKLIEDAVGGLAEARAALRGRVSVSWTSLTTSDTALVAAKGAPAPLHDAVERAAESADLVIAWGDPLADVTVDAARRHPAVKFVLVSYLYLNVLPPNLSEGSFADTVEAFIAGAAAAVQTRTGLIGLIEPVDRGPQRVAFQAGAYYASPRVRVLEDFVGVSRALDPLIKDLPPSWTAARYAGTAESAAHDPGKAEEVALAQYDLGADIVYADAGPANAGIYRAAMRRGRWLIARGPLRSGERPRRQPWSDQVLTSVIERPDLAALHLVNQFLSDTPLPRHFLWGLTYPQPQPREPLIGFLHGHADDSRARDADAILTQLMENIRAERVVVPYSTGQLNNFLRDYPP
ncbi:MAG TPA: BMP family ABC transporter substrate-binding protein [bacterium]|nr:BMP family ABC transporter substrate-binding protein [bacterium]